MNVFSYSRLKQYVDCPKSFHNKYVLEIEEPVSEALVLGKAVHAALERFLKAQQAGEKANMTECVAAAVGEAALPISFDEALRLCLNPAIHERTFCYGPAVIETRFDVPLDDAGRYTLQGTIDYSETGLADGSAYLLDWKTNRVKYSANSLQMRLYACAMAQMYGVERVLAHLVFLRYQSNSCAEEVIIEAPAMEEARRWALQTAQEIDGNIAALQFFEGDAATLFPARPCAACQYCGYAFQCVQGMALQPARIGSQEQAEQMAGEVLRLDTATTAMKEALKGWVKSTKRPVCLPGGEFRFTSTTTWNFGSDGLQNLCSRISNQGEDYWQYLTIGAAQLRKLDLEEGDLLAYGKRKQSETFRFVRGREGSSEGGDNHANHQESAGPGPAPADAGAAA